MSVVIRLKVPIEMHYTVIPMGTSKVNSSGEKIHFNDSSLQNSNGFQPCGHISIRLVAYWQIPFQAHICVPIC